MPRGKYSADELISFRVPEDVFKQAQECAETLKMYYADFNRYIYTQGVRNVARQLFPERFMTEEQWAMIIKASGLTEQYAWVLQRLVEMAQESPPPDLDAVVAENKNTTT